MKLTHISPEFNYINVEGTLSMKEKKSFFGSKLLKFENQLNITDENLIYYQNSNNEQLDLATETFNNPIIYDTNSDKLNYSSLLIDNSQTIQQKNDKTSWILSVNYNDVVNNYIFAEFKKCRTFEGVKNSMCLSNDVNKSIKEYIQSNVISRYEFQKIDIFINYLELVDGNLRFNPTWDSKIVSETNLLKSFETNNDTLNGKLEINFNQEKSSLNYTFKYYYNLYFTKL